MKNALLGMLAAAGLFTFATASQVFADVPKDKEVLKLNHVDGTKGEVTFEHAKHANEYKKQGGAKIVCKDCHHTMKTDEPAAGEKTESCTSCHVKEGEPQKEVDGKKASFMAVKKGSSYNVKTIIFHARCSDGCHKAVEGELKKKISACKTCHAGKDAE